MSILTYLCVFLLGQSLVVFLSFLIESVVLVLLILLAGFFCLLPHVVARTLGVFLWGFCVSTWQVDKVISAQMDEQYEGVDIPAHIEVLTNPRVSGRNFQFDASVVAVMDVSQGITGLDSLVNQKVKLNAATSLFHQPLVQGQTWRVLLRLKRPRGFVNPGGFDYQAWLLYHGYVATGYVSPKRELGLVTQVRPGVLHRVRADIALQLQTAQGIQFNRFYQALLIGDRSAMGQADWDVLLATGTAHLIAISGLHIGLVGVLAFYCARRALAIVGCSHLGMLRFMPGVISIVMAGLYAALSGFAIPAQRAWLMVLVINAAYMLGRRFNPMHILLFAANLVVLMNPFALLQNSFYLSFGAVLVLIYSFSSQVNKRNAFQSLVRAQWVIFCGLASVLALRQLPVSLSGPLANLIAVPFISFLVIPLLFFVAGLSMIHTDLAGLVLQCLDWIFWVLWSCLTALAKIDALFYFTRISSLVGVVALLLGTVLMLSPVLLSVRFFGLAMLSMVYSMEPEKPRGLIITVLDVGQGLAVVLHTENHTVIYDVGAKFSERFDIGSRVVAPYLSYVGVDTIDLVVLSHGDNDHAGGIVGLSGAKSIDEISANHDMKITGDKIREVPCVAGKQWVFDGVEIEAIWPAPPFEDLSSNNRSCVLSLRWQNFSAIFTGDIEQSVEKSLMGRQAHVLPRDVDLLVVPHHGSATSSSETFVKYLAPESAIISAGYKNPYGHPPVRVVDRYRSINSRVYNTANHGAVVIRVDLHGSVEILATRRAEKKPWHW